MMINPASDTTPEAPIEFVGCDINPKVMKLWRGIRYEAWKPPNDDVHKEEWERCRELARGGEMSPYLTFVGFGCSFHGTFYGSYANPRVTKSSGPYYRSREIRNVLNKHHAALMRVSFPEAREYTRFTPRGCFIYCDPPYKGTQMCREFGRTFHTKNHFDHDVFWETIREWSKYNVVFISELEAPDDFVSVWSKSIAVTCRGANTHNVNRHTKCKRRMERLFTHSSIAP